MMDVGIKSKGKDLGGRTLIILRTSAGLTRRRVLTLYQGADALRIGGLGELIYL